MITLRGTAFPFRIVDGRVAVSEGGDKTAADVRHLLATRVGERVLRRTYGGGVHQYLHEGDDQATRSLLRHDVEQALAAHLPSLRLTAPVRVLGDGQELRVRLEYQIDPGDVVRSVEVSVGGGSG